MSGRSKNHILKGGTSPYSLCMGVSPPPGAHAEDVCNLLIQGPEEREEDQEEVRLKIT